MARIVINAIGGKNVQSNLKVTGYPLINFIGATFPFVEKRATFPFLLVARKVARKVAREK